MPNSPLSLSGCTVSTTGDTDGTVLVTVYPVFPGIEIAYCDVHASYGVLERSGPGLLEISHCRRQLL